MCLILLAWRAHPEHLLVVAANRDEFFDRRATAAAFWDDHPEILAGRDLTANGTWLGVTRGGRFASITNYRNPAERMPTAPSRGQLVANFLAGTDPPSAHFNEIASRANQYNGYSMIAGDGQSLAFFSNREGRVREIEPGVHGLSNHLLNTPWPKVVLGKARLAELLDKPFHPESFLDMLGDVEPTHDRQLPDTGVGAELERKLSSIRIAGGHYGTRCSTLLRLGADGKADFWERSYNSAGGVSGTVQFGFKVPTPGQS